MTTLSNRNSREVRGKVEPMGLNGWTSSFCLDSGMERAFGLFLNCWLGMRVGDYCPILWNYFWLG